MENLTPEDNTKNKELAAPTTNPQTTYIEFKDNSISNQRLKILAWLYDKGNITTLQARDDLDVMSVSARVCELREMGYQIVTVRDNWTSPHGINHKGVARYVLTQYKQQEGGVLQ